MAKSLFAAALLACASAAPLTNWTIIADFNAIAIALDQVDGKTGYVGAGVNGQGYQLWKTTDNWQDISATPFYGDFVLTDVASYASNVQVVGTLDFYYSNNGGKTYSNSTLPYVGTSQSVANIGPVEQEIGFGMVGAFVVNLAVQDEGIAVSFNAGANYSVSNISMFDCFARYGAFPSDQTFFVNAAQWPGIGSDDEQTTTTGAGSLKGDYIVNREHYTNPQDIPLGSTLLKAFGARAHVLLTPDKKSVFATVKKDHVFNANARGNGPNITTYYDQVAKTTDGGKTWNLVYNVFNVNAGNMIHCTSETHCCFPAEAPGVRGTQIICTFDGSNFQVTYNNPDTFSSIVGMAALSEDIWWASGAELDDLAPKNSQFYLSTDGGRSWNPTGPQFSQLYAIDIDCVPSAGQCWALLLNQPNQSFSIATLSP